MSSLSVYALLDEEPTGPLGAGIAGEPLRVVRCGELRAIVGDIGDVGEPAADLAPTPESLAAHDAVVRRLAEQAGALLPVRFGERLAGESALAERLALRARDFAEALALVRGCVQMTLRVFGEPGAPPPPPEESSGPGTRYLEGRRRELERARSLPEIEPLRDALRPLLRAERILRQESGRLLGTAYHLVPRESAGAYLDAIRTAGGPAGTLPGGRRVAATGPWPPYAFAPGGLP